MKGASSSITVGQLLIVGFDGVEMTPRLCSLLTRLQPAGVILFGRNIKTAEQTWRLLRELPKMCFDATVYLRRSRRRPRGPISGRAGANSRGCGSVRLRRSQTFPQHGEIIGENCRTLGFNVDFAPVLDLAFEASRRVMSTRSVSADPQQTIAYAREFLAGLRATGILGCGKHFPGLGEGTLDSHHELPVIDKPMKKLWAEDLLPYRALRAQMPMIMISHAAYPQVTKERTPASLSKVWITDILRKRIGYHKLIVSDDLEMGGVLSAAPVGPAAVEFVRAGGDLCLVCHREDYIAQAFEGISKTAERDPKFATRVEESIRRVLQFKKKSAKILRRGKEPSATTAERLSRKLWEFSEQVRLEALNRAENLRLRR